MAWEGWFTVLVLIGVVAALARELAGADLIVMFGLVALASVGVLTPAETFQGFSNPAVPTIGILAEVFQFLVQSIKQVWHLVTPLLCDISTDGR